MDSKVCVNCNNTSAVNATDNRLVTESCGHVKCIQCLLKETSGCEACKKPENGFKQNGEYPKKTDQKSVISDPEQAEGSAEDSGAESGLTVVDEAVQTDIQEINDHEDYEKPNGNIKLNTSHIIILKDGERKGYLCTLCNRKFTARSQVTYHAYCNGQKKPFECKDCNKSFATLSHYKYHRQSKHPTTSNHKYYSCNLCNSVFIQKSKLKRHNLKHTKEKMYRCKECDKSFNNRSALRKHGLMHSGRQPYACPHCLRRFRDSSNLRKHIHNKHNTDKTRSPGSESQESEQRVVYNRRKHTCAHCPKSFHSRKDLRRHEDIHTEDKPFVCSIRDSKCKQPSFRRRDNYNRHLRNTHGVTPLVTDATHNEQNGITDNGTENVPDEIQEKAKLQVLNPLPPLPEDVIQKHLYTEERTAEEQTIDNEQPAIDKTCERRAIEEETINLKNKIEVPVINKVEERVIDKTDVPVIDKSYIIEANNARESVICKVRERKASSPVPAYVHKLKIANSLNHKEVCLPPIDTRKLVELVTLYPHSKEEPSRSLDVTPLLVKDVQTLKNILHDKPPPPPCPPAVHWRKKRLATDADHD